MILFKNILLFYFYKFKNLRLQLTREKETMISHFLNPTIKAVIKADRFSFQLIYETKNALGIYV